MAQNLFDLTGKVGLVTGGASGIGLGMAHGMAKAGMDIMIWGRTEAKNLAAVEQLKAHGGRVMSRAVDVADEAAVVEGMAQAVADLGRMDTVIANAGVSGRGNPFVETSVDAWRAVLDINLDGVFFTLREACKHMVERAKAGDPGGSLIAIASTAAIHGAARNEAYGASKAAVVSMIRAIAVEHARYGVRANSVLPGWVASDLTSPMADDDKFNRNVISRAPVRRWGEPEDFEGVAVYLSSPLSSFHTGDSIVIDGGYTVY